MDPKGIDRATLDRLYSVAMEAAIARIEKDGTFQPLLFEVRPGGAVQAVAVLDPGSIAGHDAVLDRLCELLRQRAVEAAILGAAIAIHHREERRIEIRLRAPGHAADIATPYGLVTRGLLRRQRRVTMGRPRWRHVGNEIFA